MATVYGNLANYIVNPTENDVYGDGSVGDGRILQELYLARSIYKAGSGVNSIISGFTLPSSGATSAATVAAGSAVVGGYYIFGTDTVDISDALTGTGTWWVWLVMSVDGNGKVDRPELYITSGATRPTEPTEQHTLLGHITVSSTTITGATDYRCQNQVCWGSFVADGGNVTSVKFGSNNWAWSASGLDVTITWDTPFLVAPVGFIADSGANAYGKVASGTTSVDFTLTGSQTTVFKFFG